MEVEKPTQMHANAAKEVTSLTHVKKQRKLVRGSQDTMHVHVNLIAIPLCIVLGRQNKAKQTLNMYIATLAYNK